MTGIVRSPHHEGNPMLYVNRRLRKRTRGASLSPGSRSLSASICPDRSSYRSSLQWDDGWPVFPSISRSRTGPDCGLTGAITLKLHQVHSNWPKLANIFTASLHRPCTMKEQAMSGRCSLGVRPVLPLAPSSISRAVTKLVDKGLIQRPRLLSDRMDCAMRRAYGKETTDEKPGGQLSGSEMRFFASRPDRKRSMETDDLLQEIEALRARLTKLSEASRRVSENLDLNIVLQEVIDSARYLTSARYGALLTYEPSGAIQDFLTSGLSAEEIKRLKTLPQGLGLLGYMNEIREPLRLTDIASHPSSVGFPEDHPPMKNLLGMPIRRHGEHVGNIYLTEKEGGWEFTGEDQDVLVMFASQAGAAIFNARRYEEQQQARAGLEALVNIGARGSPGFRWKNGNARVGK